MIDDWNDLRIFLAVARAGGPGGAAKTLAVDQSTIFRRLRRIEDNLGSRLFERHKSGYILTSVGATMLEHSETIERQMECLNLSVAAQDVRPEGLIRLTTTHSTAELLIAPHLQRFFETYPGIQVAFNITAQQFDLSRYQTDVAVRATLDPPEHLIGRLLKSYTWKLYAHRNYFAKHGRPRTVQDLQQHRVILPNEELGQIRMMRRLSKHLKNSQHQALTANDLNFIYCAAQQELGLALLPNYFSSNVPNLEAIDLPEVESESKLWLLVHPEMAGLARIKALTSFLFEILNSSR